MTGTRLEWPKTLRLLAHELRAPLGILQGYLRLLKEGRVDRDSEMNMLAIMLKETGRISTLARQASDLAAWQSGNSVLEPAEISALSLVERLAAGAPPLDIVALPARAAEWKVASVHPTSLIDALVAMIGLARRETPDAPIGVALSVTSAAPLSLTVALGPTAALTTASQAAPASGDKALSLESGGHGLALVVAAAVLDAHAALLSTTSDTVVVTLPLRGQQ